jgi:prepilin-type N-terminal cleavage/methylation domain-containing protein
MRTPQPSAFTLIELLVVISVICVLLAMLVPILGIAKRFAERTNTESLLRKVDTAVRLFKTDVRIYPWDGHLQPALLADGVTANPDFDTAYPDPSLSPAAWSNRLYYALSGCDPSSTVTHQQAIADVLTDAENARRAFNYDLSSSGKYPAETLSRYTDFAFLISDTMPVRIRPGMGLMHYDPATSLPVVLNRMAQERYSLAMLAGAVNLTGPETRTITLAGTTYASANPKATTRATSKVMYNLGSLSSPAAPAQPASRNHPGWSDNYLHGELQPHDISGHAIVDIWGRPLIYVCQVLPGCSLAGAATPLGRTKVGSLSMNIDYVDDVLYGLGPMTRRILDARDAYQDQTVLAADPPYLPDPDNRKRSDIRRYAGASFANEFELWSAGRDGRFAWMRDDQANADNLSIRNYLLGLP